MKVSDWLSLAGLVAICLLGMFVSVSEYRQHMADPHPDRRAQHLRLLIAGTSIVMILVLSRVAHLKIEKAKTTHKGPVVAVRQRECVPEPVPVDPHPAPAMMFAGGGSLTPVAQDIPLAEEDVGWEGPDILDDQLLSLTPDDHVTVRTVTESILILGRTGSGKTSSSGKAAAAAVVRHPKSGGLILAAKAGEDWNLWKGIFERAGRSQDLLRFAPDSDLRFNVLNYIAQRDKEPRNIVGFLGTVGETLVPRLGFSIP